MNHNQTTELNGLERVNLHVKVMLELLFFFKCNKNSEQIYAILISLFFSKLLEKVDSCYCLTRCFAVWVTMEN